jgi:hypothetical protein
MIRCALAAVLVLGVMPPAKAEVTFNRDVLPVLQKNCQDCHRPGEAAPMSLLTYEQARPWAAAIAEAVKLRKMPPWHAEEPHGAFRNDRRLSSAEIDTLVAWARSGAPAGDPAQAPPPKTFVEGWTIGKPDVVIDMGADYKVPSRGTVEYTYFVVPTRFSEDKWIEKIEVRPKMRGVVHHIVLMARAPGSPVWKEAKSGVPYVPPKGKAPASRPPDTAEGRIEGLGDGMPGVEMVSVYVPGGVAYQTRAGQARLIRAGSDLVFQMHYTANGTEETDRSEVGIVFAKEPPKERVVNTFVSNRRLRIPPGAGAHRVDARVTLQQEVKLESFFPHMHVRGKAMEYRAVFPTGETQLLLRVPRYDFNWQQTYYLAKPLTVPKGTRLEVTAWYDNSPNNPANPDPQSEVFWGDQSWEEMLAGFVDLAIPVSMDPLSIAPKPPPKPAPVATAAR